MSKSHRDLPFRYERTDDPRVVQVVITQADGSEICRAIRGVPMSLESLQDDPLPIEPKPSINPNVMRMAVAEQLLAPLLALFNYIGWCWRVRKTPAKICPHPKFYRVTITLEGHTSTLSNVNVCGSCLEAYCNEDSRRICVACHQPIFSGTFVNDRRVNGEDRFVHHNTCSGEKWSATIWRGDHVQTIGHGI